MAQGRAIDPPSAVLVARDCDRAAIGQPDSLCFRNKRGDDSPGHVGGELILVTNASVELLALDRDPAIRPGKRAVRGDIERNLLAARTESDCQPDYPSCHMNLVIGPIGHVQVSVSSPPPARYGESNRFGRAKEEGSRKGVSPSSLPS